MRVPWLMKALRFHQKYFYLCSEDGLMDFDWHKGVNLWQNFHFLFRCSSFYFHLPLWVNHKNHNHPLGLWLCFMIENGILDNIFTLRYKKRRFSKSQPNRFKQIMSDSSCLFETIWNYRDIFSLQHQRLEFFIFKQISKSLNMVWSYWMDFVCLLLYMMNAGLLTLCIFAPMCFQVAFALMYIICVLSSVPQGVIQNGARMMSQGLFPGIRPLPINPIVSRTAAVRSVLSLRSRSAHFLTHYMIDRVISQSESCLHCSALAHISSLPFSLKSGCSVSHISLDQSIPGHCRQSSIRAKAPLLYAWCDMNNWSLTLSFFGMTKHTD